MILKFAHEHMFTFLTVSTQQSEYDSMYQFAKKRDFEDLGTETEGYEGVSKKVVLRKQLT